MLSADDRSALRKMNVTLTEQAIKQCGEWIGVRNQIEFGTQICNALDEFRLHTVSVDLLRRLSEDHDIIFPWSLQYGNVRQPFNQRLIRLPLAIVYPRTAAEVSFWVSFVREHDFTVSIRSGNNSYEGLSTLNQIVIDLTFLTLDGEKQFEIDASDPENPVVRVASGVRLGVLYTDLANAGFAFAGGQCAPVCVGGLVGTGGIGWSTRRFGWACDQLVAVECVLADGRIITADKDHYADLYRACKGAGGAGLCVMTILTLKIEPVVPILWYSVFCDAAKNPLDNGAKILAEWQNLADAPQALSSSCFAATAQPVPSISANGWYRVEDNDCSKARKRLECILNDCWLNQLPDVEKDVLIIDFDELLSERLPGGSTIDAATTGAYLVPMPFFNQWKLKCANTFRKLTADELQPAFTHLQECFLDPSAGVGYLSPWILGGASNSIDPKSAVIPVREDAVMWIHYGSQWNDQAVGQQALEWVDRLAASLGGVVSQTAWVGIPDLQLGSQLTDSPCLDYVNAYWKSTQHDFVPFLIEVKNRYDPEDLFQFAQSIPLSMDPGELV
jgi:FAD/FMN-containing dehydrogenase